MDGNKVLYATRSPIPITTTHPVGKYPVTHFSRQFEVHLREAEGNANEFWYWDEKNKVVRSIDNGERCLTWDHESPLANGSLAVARPCPTDESPENIALYYTKETYTISPDADRKLCLGTSTSSNNENATLVWATCSATDKSQNFYPYYRYQTQGPHWNRLQNE